MRGALWAAVTCVSACAQTTSAPPLNDVNVGRFDAGEFSDGGLPEDAGNEAARALSETGLYSDIATRALSSNILSYRVRYQLWADGAEKDRYLFLPDGAQIDTSDPDGWRFPIGTKAWKSFNVGGRVIETRLLGIRSPVRRLEVLDVRVG